MRADTLIESFSARGFRVLTDGVVLKVFPSSALTDEDRAAIRDHKAELISLLRPVAAPPPAGSIARPVVCRGAEMPNHCPWNTCDGRISGQGGNLYLCADCGSWFELKPLDPGVYVGDLVGDFDAGGRGQCAC